MSQILNEHRIKRLLTRHIKHGDWKRSDALISEYFVENASRRADLVVVNGALRAYEIKSDVDHLTRLTGQVEAYTRYFESVTVVCTRRHLTAVLQQTDSSVGVLCASNDGIEEHRTPVTRQLADTDTWLSHLPITAIREALTRRGIQCPRVNRHAVLEVARTHMTTEQARSEVMCYLKTHKLKQRRALQQERTVSTSNDPFAEHAAMLRSYLISRGITAR
ncbi:sce7726 family protein [Burkholderia multivorans]|uniref:sce7726 family protein n=1 Tax=Burkholderia multivorans TaxID=87883 RepID=UPI0011B1D213